ncbi:MAG: hypothetical protein K9M57_05420 [Phycisphaerae bacterium]|nr:hypothetical protein [Phycisphaerae bacterium]
MKKFTIYPVAFLLGMVLLMGCEKPPAAPEAGTWSLTEVSVIDGFDIPECVVSDGKGKVYVSNVATATAGYWDDDGLGFISRVDADGTIEDLRWVDSTSEAKLNGPKGLCILGEYLYINDNGRLLRCALESAGPPEEISLPQTGQLNDLATDGEAVYVSDTELGRLWRVSPDGTYRSIPAPQSINGVTCYGGKLYAVSWDLHELYELDPAGKKRPEPFGLAEHFKNLDGIEVLADGSFLVSDFTGGKVCTVSSDRTTVKTLAELTTPADIGLDREKKLVYVPSLTGNQVIIYRLGR